MKDADIKIMQEAVAEAVRTTVNGKIDGIKRHLEEQDEKFEGRFKDLEAKVGELKPVREAQQVVSGLVTFIKWIAGAILAAFGVYKLFK